MRLWGAEQLTVSDVSRSSRSLPFSDTFRIRSVGTQIGWFWLSKVWQHSGCGGLSLRGASHLNQVRLNKSFMTIFPAIERARWFKKRRRDRQAVGALNWLPVSKFSARDDFWDEMVVLSWYAGRCPVADTLVYVCFQLATKGGDSETEIQSIQNIKTDIYSIQRIRRIRRNKQSSALGLSHFSVLMLSRCLISGKMTQFDLKLIFHV